MRVPIFIDLFQDPQTVWTAALPSLLYLHQRFYQVIVSKILIKK